MSDRVTTAARIALTLLPLASFACAETHEGAPEPDIEGAAQEVIGGVPANSPALNAIGTIGVIETYVDCYTGQRISYNRTVCTASLIGERVVLTAKHCVDALSARSGSVEPYFATGPNEREPELLVPIVDVQSSPVDVGGFNMYGRDVAVAYLGSPVTTIKPLRIAQLDESAIGTRFGAIGFGVQDNFGTSGTRMAGSVTLNALQGRVFELIFGDFESFRDWYLSTNGTPRPGPIPPRPVGGLVFADGGVPPSPLVDASLPVGDGGVGDGGVPDWIDSYLRNMYETTELLPGYEAYVGNRPGDAQLCFGDSGSPLTRASGGELYAYGVVSGGIYSRSLICDYGAVYASFGPETVAFLQAAQAWVDPCDGVTPQGTCDGDVAVRCTTLGEGNRRVTSTDCSLFGQTCAIGADFRAACVAPGEVPVVIDPLEDMCEGFPGLPGVPGVIDPGMPDVGDDESVGGPILGPL